MHSAAAPTSLGNTATASFAFSFWASVPALPPSGWDGPADDVTQRRDPFTATERNDWALRFRATILEPNLHPHKPPECSNLLEDHWAAGGDPCESGPDTA